MGDITHIIPLTDQEVKEWIDQAKDDVPNYQYYRLNNLAVYYCKQCEGYYFNEQPCPRHS
jgi:hypothetical protein